MTALSLFGLSFFSTRSPLYAPSPFSSLPNSVNLFVCSRLWKILQFSSVAQSCPTLCNPMNHSMPGFPVHHHLPEFTQLTSIESVMPSTHLILCHPLLLLPPIPPSIRVFSNESTLRMRWATYWSFSFSIIPSKEHSRLISFRMDWLDLLAVQGTFKSLFQHHSSKASILWHSAFSTDQLSHPYMTTGKAILITGWICLSPFDSPLYTPGRLCLLPPSSLLCITLEASLRDPDGGEHIGK